MEKHTSVAELISLIIEKLAYVRGVDPDELQRHFQACADEFEIDSKEGQTVAIMIEEALDCDGLIRPEDERPENLTTIESLARLIERRLRERNGGT